MDADVKGFFKKKRPEGLGATNINNTAPVKDILNEFEDNNQLAFRFLNWNRKPRYYKHDYTAKHFVNPGHQLAAFPDDWDGDIGLEYFQSFPYKCMQPKMLTVISNQLKDDPVAAYIKKKDDWHHQLKCHKAAAIVNSSSRQPLIDKIKKHSEDIISCPRHIVKMAELWEANPDPYFNSKYNWYYAGNGNMHLVCVSNKEYLMCCEFQFCHLFEFNSATVTLSRHSTTSFDCGEGNNICEGICSSQNIIALRTMYKIFVLRIVSTEEKLEIQQLKVSESKIAYTGISFDEHHKNILYVTDLNNTLKIVNLDRLTARTVELKNSVKSLVNNWNTVISNERAYYTHVSTNAITLYDKRVNGAVRRWSNPNRVSDDACCNLISTAKYSPSNPFLYVATNHHLILMDMRYQKNQALKPIQRWTHGMQLFPTCISISNFEYDKQLICLSSQWCEDTCVVPNYVHRDSCELEFKGITIPYRLPSVLETLNEARLQSLCTDLYKHVENRLVAALTGSVLLEHGEQYVVLSQNSLGDVTSHVLYPEYMHVQEDDALQALHEWSLDYEVEKKDYVVSFIKDIKDVWKRLENIPDGEINKRFEDKTNFSEQEVMDAFANEELDQALLDVWLDNEDGGQVELNDSDDNKSVSSLSLHIMKDVD